MISHDESEEGVAPLRRLSTIVSAVSRSRTRSNVEAVKMHLAALRPTRKTERCIPI